MLNPFANENNRCFDTVFVEGCAVYRTVCALHAWAGKVICSRESAL